MMNNKDKIHSKHMHDFIVYAFILLLLWFVYEVYIIPIEAEAIKKEKLTKVEFVGDTEPLDIAKKEVVDSTREFQQKEESPQTIYNEYPKLTSIPKNFIGHDIRELYSEVSNIIGTKDKFQSTKEYQQQKKKRIEASSVLKNYILFLDNWNLFIDYDADNKKLVFDYPDEVYVSDELDLGGYIGSNAFGVGKEVKKYKRDVYVVNFKNTKKRKSGKLPLEPHIAATYTGFANRLDLDFIYISKVVSPYILEASDDRKCVKPTIDRPEEGCTRWHNLSGELLGLIIFNPKTGEIIHQEKL